MANTDLIPVPPVDSVNTGLTSPTQGFMLQLFGVPGVADPKCGKVTNPNLEPHIRTAKVGPFKANGLDIGLDSLQTIFEEVKASRPDLYNQVKYAGMLCVRKRRKNGLLWSNHAWGSAVDLYFGKAVTPQGTAKTYRGILDLYFFFHKHGWYWGGGYSGKSVDSMHFEMSEELLTGHFGG
jgi:hypothetical protein